MVLAKILVIRHGALGDLVQSMGPLKAIRSHHTGAHITLLTTAPFYDFMVDCPWLDDVWTDSKPELHQLGEWWRLRNRLTNGDFDRVYDLQTSTRSSLYFRVFPAKNRPEWSGIVKAGSHYHSNPNRDQMHTLDRQAEQLRVAGIVSVPSPDLSWARNNAVSFELHCRYAFLVPGGSPHRPGKRWPLELYITFSKKLQKLGIQPVFIGGKDELRLSKNLQEKCPEALNLVGRTRISDLVTLAHRASVVVGNDTGPMHIAALSSCPAVVLFSDHSEPNLCAPRGDRISLLKEANLGDLSVDAVWAAAEDLGAFN